MGSSESTGRSNGGENEEENNTSGGAAAAAAIGTTAVVAWGVKRILSDDIPAEKWSQFKNEMDGAFRALGLDGSSTSSAAPPRPFKLNTDGACLPNNGDGDVLRGPSGYAGILEDDRGYLVRGFRGFIGVSDCLTAEIHGILKGLELLDKLGYKGSILENDSQQAVDWVTRQDDEPGKSLVIRDCWHLIKKSRQLVGKNNITVRFCYRNANKPADRLARIAIKKGEAYVEFTDVDGEINGVDQPTENNTSGGAPGGGAPNFGAAAAAIGTAAVVAWGVKRMLSDNQVKLNTDGACLPHHGNASGYAGILEDDRGKWVRGFRGFIGVSDCLTAEIYGILKGLELLDKLGYKGSILENDSQAAVDWVTGQDNKPGKRGVIHDCWHLIEKSRQLVCKNNITVRCCSRNDNKLADKLARLAIEKRDAYVEFTDVHGEINC